MHFKNKYLNDPHFRHTLMQSLTALSYLREALLSINPRPYLRPLFALSPSLSLCLSLPLRSSFFIMHHLPNLRPTRPPLLSFLIVVPSGITQTVLVIPMRGLDLARDLIVQTTIAPLLGRTEILIVRSARLEIYKMSAS